MSGISLRRLSFWDGFVPQRLLLRLAARIRTSGLDAPARAEVPLVLAFLRALRADVCFRYGLSGISLFSNNIRADPQAQRNQVILIFITEIDSNCDVWQDPSLLFPPSGLPGATSELFIVTIVCGPLA